MRAFDYIAVETIAEACSVLAGHGPEAAILAGGTDLLIELRRATTKAPKVVLDISRAPELGGIGEADGSITIKPLATHSEVARSGLVQKFAPLLGSAASAIGSPQIRERGTVGGNIMNAAACADTVPPLVALGATVTLQSKGGCRELALAELFVKPYQTKAKPDELLTAICFPKLAPAARSAFIKLGRRNALSISRISVAAVLQMGSDGRIVEARIVPGAAFPTWKRVPAAEQMLLGKKPTAKLFAAAGQKVSEEMIKATGRRWSTEYKEPVIAVLVRRALEQCAGGVLPKSSAPAKVGRAVPSAPRQNAKTRTFGDSSHAGGALGTARPTTEASITTTINGRSHTLTIPANRTLLDLLRDDLGLLGTKCGCEIGECGACTVLLEGKPVNSCLVLAPQIDGREVVTVEGLAQDGKLHPLQDSFLDHDAVHCGFCTPGMLLSAKALLDWNPRPTETEIRTAISGNLCRCTGYQQIVQAIEKAAAWSRAKDAKPQAKVK
ncbi:MAG: FAD binding domain-containing protein [Verrucomicrobiota bacterium]|jgi:xanthine dehydrogenase iron-sulfur cluster and FAD-binding subunit A